MSFIKYVMLLAILAGATLAHADEESRAYWGNSTWQDPNRGFLWYSVPQPKKIEPHTVVPKAKERMTNKELGAELERLLAVAVEKQTTEAVKEYLFLQQYSMDRASRFSDVFQRTVWQTPELDYSLRGRPTNAMAMASYDVEHENRRNQASDDLAKTHGMFFFFRKDCVYCHQIAPILRMYQRNYGMEVFAISLDGGTLAEFPEARRDNGASQNLNVTVTPALFLADKRSGKIQPIGYGVMSLDEIVNRVYVLTQTEPGQEY